MTFILFLAYIQVIIVEALFLENTTKELYAPNDLLNWFECPCVMVSFNPAVAAEHIVTTSMLVSHMDLRNKRLYWQCCDRY